MRPVFLIFIVSLIASFGVAWSQEHYFAPYLGVYMVVWLMTLRWIRCLALARFRLGLAYVRVLPAVLAVSSFLLVVSYPHRALNDIDAKALLRQKVAASIRQVEGKHLVVVRYLPDYNFHAEWVYNAADIDHAPVVWARDMGPKKDAALLAYFKDRTAWCVTLGERRLAVDRCENVGWAEVSQKN